MWQTIGSAILGFFSKRAENKARIKEAQITAEIDRLKNTSDQSGWKDEYLVLLWSLPAIMSFIPSLQPYVREGFEILDTATPDWYVVGWLGITGAVFGLKRLIEWREK